MPSFIRELVQSNWGRAIDLDVIYPFKIEVEFGWRCPAHTEDFLWGCEGVRHVKILEFPTEGVPKVWEELQFKSSRDAIQYKLMI